MDEIDDRIDEITARRDRRARAERRLRRARRELEEHRARRKALRERLGKEEQDVARLEGLSLAALFHTVFSSRAEKLEKEREEVVRARLRLDDARTQVGVLAEEVAALEAELETLGDPARELVEVLAEKEGRLVAAGGPSGSRLAALGDERLAARAELVELDEATAAGRRAEDSLDDLLRALDRARGWGTFDMLGGGLISTAMKRSHMDDAGAIASRAQADLRRLDAELEDVADAVTAELDLSGFLSFADYFLDGLIVDWMVQSRIQKAQEAADGVREEVRAVLRRLGQRRADVLARLDALAAERAAILGGPGSPGRPG